MKFSAVCYFFFSLGHLPFLGESLHAILLTLYKNKRLLLSNICWCRVELVCECKLFFFLFFLFVMLSFQNCPYFEITCMFPRLQILLSHDDGDCVIENTFAKDQHVESWIHIQGMEDGKSGYRIYCRDQRTKCKTVKGKNNIVSKRSLYY